MTLGVLLTLLLIKYAHSQLTSQQLDLFRSYNVDITDDPTEPQKYWIFNHHGVPDHEYGPFPSVHNPNDVSAQNHTYKIPKNPTVATTPGCLSLGTIATAVNGVPLFNPYSGVGYNAVEGPNREMFDNCTGHPQRQGAYHYHTVPECLYTGKVDQFIGVALDGYPIYGPLTVGGKTLSSTDLDACHGRTVNNKYEYRLTHDFPYILGCYRGKSTKVERPQPPPPPPNGLQGQRHPGGQRPPPNRQPGGGRQPDVLKRPPPNRQPGFGRQPGQGFPMGDCLYVTFCENPANGCPCSAYTWDPNAPRTSSETCNIESTTVSAGNTPASTFIQIVHLLLVASVNMYIVL